MDFLGLATGFSAFVGGISESRLIQTTEGKPRTEYPVTVLELD